MRKLGVKVLILMLLPILTACAKLSKAEVQALIQSTVGNNLPIESFDQESSAACQALSAWDQTTSNIVITNGGTVYMFTPSGLRVLDVASGSTTQVNNLLMSLDYCSVQVPDDGAAITVNLSSTAGTVVMMGESHE